MKTYLHGRRFPFDASECPPLPWLGPEEQWVPGTFPIKGKVQMVMAPLSEFPESKFFRVKKILLLHRCPQRLVA